MADGLLKILQADFPLSQRPWDVMAERFSLRGQDVRAMVAQLRYDGIIRRISGIFEAAAMGYQTTLIAAAAASNEIESLATRISENPNVSHCYQRSDDEFPVWFTFAARGESLDQAVEEFLSSVGCEKYMILPCEKRFKLGVIIDPASGEIVSNLTQGEIVAGLVLSESQRLAAEALQVDLPDSDEPFAQLAEKCDMSVEAFLEIARELLSLGVMRRYGAVVRHNKVGLDFNVMVAWRVDPHDRRLADVAAVKSISHCYLRPARPGWDYNFYTMIHGQSRENCLASVDEVSALLDGPSHKLLWSIREFKKSHVVYK